MVLLVFPPPLLIPLQAMANDSDLNIENNIRRGDTQFINIFWLKTLENQIKCILLCILLEHTGGINMCFGIRTEMDRPYPDDIRGLAILWIWAGYRCHSHGYTVRWFNPWMSL